MGKTLPVLEVPKAKLLFDAHPAHFASALPWVTFFPRLFFPDRLVSSFLPIQIQDLSNILGG